ncbi:MAG: MBL fold metallo-hydrolase [Candidatus Micrarchaeota archaeon]|nr:MBL fold metallo-hydrolase [Candidatus Micrarchaeota archaeon]
MKITKLGHCCLLIEEDGLRVLTDPGTYSSAQDDINGIDVILITHEHSDHYDIASVKRVIHNNPGAKVFTNKAVGAKLAKEQITHAILENGSNIIEKGVEISAVGATHLPLYPSLPPIENTGYMIAEKFFYPGDALTLPSKPVPILALPVAGPWLKLSEAIDYARIVKPKVCFPVHDGILKKIGSTNEIPPKILGPLGIRFEVLEIGRAIEF